MKKEIEVELGKRRLIYFFLTVGPFLFLLPSIIIWDEQ